MATLEDVRQIASALPGSVEGTDRFAFSVEKKGKFKGYLWTWAERVDPKKARVINDSVLVVVVPNLSAKELILASDSNIYFTEPHYNGFLAVLVRLEAIPLDELQALVFEAWKSKAPIALVKEWEAKQG